MMRYATFKTQTPRSVEHIRDSFEASDYDMMMVFGTSASEQSQYLKDNPHLEGIVQPMEDLITSGFRRNF